ncbi:MAG: nucleotidyltransferase family protein [Kordiimonadaceae bacterium]|nr:nucleotidyltransferase family protein [Kordiimonadaceae bacterium]MBT6035675.1 nucleotidyltransferase family protein [Kordiimonadaceae bacterium]MBT6330626.1 nucleotidyltransferase family protein [Kordiimonadaceae bacterium]MBT7583400.1 nucleotidyltransferase family protein [Kordiimonadaceae bacterium]
MDALEIASSLGLNDWCLAAGFVRNIVWDKLHGFDVATPLNDIDFIYFDLENVEVESELRYEERLKSISNLPWSVKNQARMHVRNDDKPYSSTTDAMSYWVEVETAIGASISSDGDISLVAPFGVEALFSNTVTINQKRIKRDAFEQRLCDKKWLEIWPRLKISSG